MAFCSNCGSELEDGAVFCQNCGAKVEGEGSSGSVENSKQQSRDKAKGGLSKQKDDFNKMKQEMNTPPEYGEAEKILVDPDEKIISRLGGGWILNMIILRKVQTLNAILTDRRCYLQGNLLVKGEKGLMQHRIEKTVNVEDINATGFEYSRNLRYLLMAIACAVIGILGILLLIDSFCDPYGVGLAPLVVVIPILFLAWRLFYMYFTSKITYFYIEYAGGTIQFRVVLADYAQVQLFSKEIHRVKDFSRKSIRKDFAKEISVNG